MMIEIDLGQPDSDEFEITTIGAGHQSGESVVLHLENGQWVIIDSCVSEKKVLPLYYLEQIGVPFENVKFVICTHWHEDHVKGLPDILRECPNAKFYTPNVGDNRIFLKFVLKRLKLSFTSKSKVWKIFNDCYKVLSNRTTLQKPNFFQHEMVVYTSPNVDLFCLSPSDNMRQNFEEILLAANTDVETIEAENKLDDNMCSLSFALRFHDKRIIIGGDLECNRKDKEDCCECIKHCGEKSEKGWCNILEEINLFTDYQDYEYIQLSHHSSINGFCPRIWDEFCKRDEMICTSTIFSNNKKVNLPTKEMLEAYMNLSKSYYITSTRIGASKVKKIEKTALDDELHKTISKIQTISDAVGIICSRYKKGEYWKHYSFGTARLVTENVVKNYPYV